MSTQTPFCTDRSSRIGRSVEEITAGEVKDKFPLKRKGEFEFRFKVEAEGAGFWVDLDNQEKVPWTKNAVWMKVNRLGEYLREPPKTTPPKGIKQKS